MNLFKQLACLFCCTLIIFSSALVALTIPVRLVIGVQKPMRQLP
jgi:hypothetical protein